MIAGSIIPVKEIGVLNDPESSAPWDVAKLKNGQIMKTPIIILQFFK
jgi:hypothetical protein